MADGFTLRVINESAETPIELRLSMEPPQHDAEALGLVHRRVFADRPTVFSLPAEGLDGVAVTLSINDVTVATDNRLEDDRLVLKPLEKKCFADICGLAEIALRFSRRESEETYRIHAEPVLVCFPEGPAADNILKMADEVVRRWGEFFSDRNALSAGMAPGTGKGFADRLKNHLKQLADIVLMYEAQLGYFAVSCRTVLREVHRVEGFERLSDFTEETAQYIATHPEELMPHRGNAGIQLGSSVYMPRRTLVRTGEASPDTPENRAVAAFPLTVAEAVRAECRRIETLLERFQDTSDVPGYVAPGMAVVTEAGRRLRETLETLGRIERRLRAVALKASELFGIKPTVLRRPPQPTPVFISVPAYRLVWNAMRSWFGRTDPGYEEEAAMVLSVERSSLYEYFVLFRLIDALKANGFEAVGSNRFEWTLRSSYYTQTAGENTFTFRRNATTVTLYAQPVIYGSDKAGENGLGLKRRSSWSMQEGGLETGVTMQQTLNPFYTPDYVIKVEEEGRDTRYALLDAKLSSPWSVMTNQVPYLAYRYLTSVRTLKRGDRHLGLWLLCGHKNDKDVRVPAHLFDLNAAADEDSDIHFVRVTATDNDPLKEVTAAILAL